MTPSGTSNNNNRIAAVKSLFPSQDSSTTSRSATLSSHRRQEHAPSSPKASPSSPPSSPSPAHPKPASPTLTPQAPRIQKTTSTNSMLSALEVGTTIQVLSTREIGVIEQLNTGNCLINFGTRKAWHLSREVSALNGNNSRLQHRTQSQPPQLLPQQPKAQRVQSQITQQQTAQETLQENTRQLEDAMVARLAELKHLQVENKKKFNSLEILEKQIQQQKQDLISEAKQLNTEIGTLEAKKKQITSGKNKYFISPIESIHWEPAKLFKYKKKTNDWEITAIDVKIDTVVFGSGDQRNVYRCICKDSPSKFLAKQTKHQNISKSLYFEDVKVQCLARQCAKKFNNNNAPSKISFIKAWAIELTSRPGHPMFGLEEYLEGEFVKHNNNAGYVNTSHVHDVPQAFSHFSYQDSGCDLIIVDIQGVGYTYTDPQIHSCTGEGFGMGNKGEIGIANFFSTHSCNEVCKALNLIPLT